MQMMKFTSSILIASLAFIASASAQCEDCDSSTGKFCGIDGNCYTYNCKFFYEYGSWRNEMPTDVGGNLTCVRRNVVPTWNVYCGGGVKYGCSYCNDGPEGDETGDVIQDFSRACTAEPFPYGEFSCFDMAGADFSNFQKQSSVRQMPCDSPVYMYSSEYSINGEAFAPYQTNLSYWNIQNAYTLQANITYTVPTESPTPSPSVSPTAAPQEVPEAAGDGNVAQTVEDPEGSSRGIEVAKGFVFASLIVGSISQFF